MTTEDDKIGGPTAREGARIQAAECARLPEAQALADSARAAADAGDWASAASLWRRASFLVRHTPQGILWRQESRFADQMAREESEDIAFDRTALRTLLGLPPDRLLTQDGSTVTTFYVATLADYVLVDAVSADEARQAAIPRLVELRASRGRPAARFPIEILTVRPATESEIELMRFDAEMTADQ